MSVFTSAAKSRHTRLGVALSVAAAAVVGLAAPSSATVTAVAGTLSQTSGPSGGTNTITVTTTAAKFYAGSTYVNFQAKPLSTTACAATYVAAGSGAAPWLVGDAGVAGNTNGQPNKGALKILSTTKVAITIPHGVVLAGGATSTAFLLCVYNGNAVGSSNLLVTGTYTVAALPTIALATAGTPGLVPASGPALGGQSITVTGTNFITGLTATIGGSALTNVVINSATSFTATTPPHVAGTGLALTVTTTGGTATTAGVTNGAVYDYVNGINVTPQTSTNLVATDLDITGVGFSGMDFSTTTGTTSDNTKAHVYLVSNDTVHSEMIATNLNDATYYDNTAGAYLMADNVTDTGKTVGETAECINVLVISDTELICTMDFTTNHPANGAYTVTVVGDGAPAAAANLVAPSIVSSTSTFTVAPY